MKKLVSSLAFRLTCTYMLLFTTLAFLLLGAHYWMTIRTPYQRVKQRIMTELTELTHTHDSQGSGALQRALDARLAGHSARHAYHALIASDGRVISANFSGWPAEPATSWLRLDADTHEDGEDQDFEPLLRDHVFADGSRLLVGRDIEDIDELEEKLLSVGLGVVVTGAALGLLGGLLMSREISRRMQAVTRTATRVMAGNLADRIPLSGQSDDFDHLNAMLNQMLARIEDLVESIRRVSDNVSHELRTPLARLRTTLETLRNRGPVLAPQIDELLSEVTALERTFDAILRISRIENTRQPGELPAVDLSTVVQDAAELYAPEAEDRRQLLSISAPPGLAVQGDRDLLFQSVCNLIDNAVKYTPQGGEIAVSIRRTGDTLELVVRDSGPGVATEHLPHLTEHFFRAPATAAAPGAGLGLGLVAAVAKRHHSQLRFETGGPGLIVRWQFSGGMPS